VNRIGWLVALATLACAPEGSPNVPWVTVATRSAHAKFFPVEVGSHAVDCNACHGTAESFTEFDCVSCHMGTLKQDLKAMHAPVTGPAPGFQPVPVPVTPAYSHTCLLCHPTGQVDPATAGQNHSGLFPISATDSHAYGKTVTVSGKPVVNGCAACHVDVGNRANVDCTGCHIQNGSNGAPSPTVPADQNTAHQGKVGTVGANGVPDNLWLGTGPVGTGSGVSAQCVKCHAGDSRGGGFVASHAQAGPAHVVFGINSSNTNHFVSCDQCHTASKTPAGRQNPEFDFGLASCDKCHPAGGTGSVIASHAGFGFPIPGSYSVGDPNNSSACLGCHPNGGMAGNFNHVWFPVAQADVHNPAVAKCGDCHSTSASYQGDPANNLSLITCTGCHDDNPANTQYQNGFTVTGAHTRPRVGRDIWNIPGRYDYGRDTNPQCISCHAGNIGVDVAAWSTPLVFRLAAHDTHCRLSQPLLGGDPTHNVNRNADNGVNICFACHNATVNTGNMPWARDWTAAGPASCKACHKHQQDGAPTITCK
jgi:hypothetical protein